MAVIESRRVLDEDDNLAYIVGRMFSVVEESSNTTVSSHPSFISPLGQKYYVKYFGLDR